MPNISETAWQAAIRQREEFWKRQAENLRKMREKARRDAKLVTATNQPTSFWQTELNRSGRQYDPQSVPTWYWPEVYQLDKRSVRVQTLHRIGVKSVKTIAGQLGIDLYDGGRRARVRKLTKSEAIQVIREFYRRQGDKLWRKVV